MTRWFVWFQAADGSVPFFRVLAAESLPVAEFIANDLAARNRVKVIGIVVASEQFNPVEK